MPLILVSKGKDPPLRSRTSRRKLDAPDPKKLVAQNARVERLVTASWVDGIRRLRKNLPYASAAAAFQKGSLDDVMVAINKGVMNNAFNATIKKLSTSLETGFRAAEKGLPRAGSLRYDLANKAIREYQATTQGRLIKGVTEEVQTGIQRLIQRSWLSGLSQKDLAGEAKNLLRNAIGLDARQVDAVASMRAAGAIHSDVNDASERMLEVRAKRIARTEASFALNDGQRIVWDTAAEQGLINASTTRKVWVIEASACPEICLPMDGVSVLLDETFYLPDGTEVSTAPAHPNCRCLCSLELADDGG